jgi:hypothetical protein
MADRSALDREGAGSNPASGFTANPGYASLQLARALITVEAHDDAATRQRAVKKARKWQTVFEGMLTGNLTVGSRTPVPDAPAWATLEVLTGGFATGTLLAGGALNDHEEALAAHLSVEAGENNRLALNLHFLTERGVAELQERLRNGAYEVELPEEGALLVVGWLLAHGHIENAHDLLDELGPFLGALRFYPRFVDEPRRFGSRVFVRDVNATIGSLEAIQPNRNIVTQRETIEVWLPLYDEAISLLLETVEGAVPDLARGESGSPLPRESGRYRIEGGWPCQRYPDDWSHRVKNLLDRIEAARREHSQSSRPVHRKSSLAQLVPLLKKCATNPKSLKGREVGKIRLAIARYVAKRGTPDSASCLEARQRQAVQAKTPVFSAIAKAVIDRLRPFPGDQGVDSIEPIIQPVNAGEATTCGVEAGTSLPESIRRKAERCLSESVEALVERGIIPSGDVLAEVLPQVTAGVRSAGIGDPQLRQLSAAVYRAFRRRRSLLLLDLQGQVKIDELPWVKAIETFRDETPSIQRASAQVLEEVACLTLTSFPQAILPNKLLQEIRALAKGAGIDLPIVDELAADIFMGEFSPKFTVAAKVAAQLLRGTLYERYYALDYKQVGVLLEGKKRKVSFWNRLSATPPSNPFAQLCISRAGATMSGRDPAINGMIIEQQQVITTQNLAPLFSTMRLADVLAPHLDRMARHCFEWICRRQQINEPKWHARLIMVKNTAYAWRQMVFYLSFLGDQERQEFVAWAEEHLAAQRPDFCDRFSPVLTGLKDAVGGRPVGEGSQGRRFLGWSKERHWLLRGG